MVHPDPRTIPSFYLFRIYKSSKKINVCLAIKQGLCVTFKFHNPQPRKSLFFFSQKLQVLFYLSIKFLHIKKKKKKKKKNQFFKLDTSTSALPVRSTQVIPRLKPTPHAYKQPERYRVLQSPLTSLPYIYPWPDHNRKRVSKFSRDFSKNTTVFWALCQLHYIFKQHVICKIVPRHPFLQPFPYPIPAPSLCEGHRLSVLPVTDDS